MATSKTSKKPAKKPTPKQPTPTPADTYDPNKDRRALRELVAHHGDVTPEHREAFGELVSDARRAELGARTRGLGVFRESVAWAVAISRAFEDYPAAVKPHYSIERFKYLLHCVGGLDTAIQAQSAQRGGQGTVRWTAADREEAARKARNTLIAKMTGFAGAREAERAALAGAMGHTTDATALGTSIQSLATLAREWLARTDRKAKIQAESAGLTEGVVQEALDAAEALTGAATTATLAGKKAGTDSPAVNLAEGSVLHEMIEARRCFAEAHTATSLVPRLVPGPATKHVVGSKMTEKKEPAAEAPKDQQPATNGVPSPATTSP